MPDNSGSKVSRRRGAHAPRIAFLRRESLQGAATVVCMGMLAACGGSNGGGMPVTYTIGVNVSGLAGTGLVLQLNTGGDLAITADGSATFATAVASGTSYTVSVKTQPSSPAQTCTVAQGSGTIAAADVTGVAITCTTVGYTVGATVSGMTGSGLVLQLNGGNDLSITADGAVSFPTELDSGASYAITVRTQPTQPVQVCTVTDGSGTVGVANVTDVNITCATPPPATMLYSAINPEGTQPTVVGYPANISGSVSETVSFTANEIAIDQQINDVTTDSFGNIYVSVTKSPNFGPGPSDNSPWEVLAFAATTATGVAHPVRAIQPPGVPEAVVVDGAGNVYLSTLVPASGQGFQPAILEFDPGASGKAAPTRTINVGGLCSALAVDPSGNVVCAPLPASGSNLTGPNEILLFTSGQAGDAMPARTITLGGALQIVDLTLDPSGNIYVATTSTTGPTGILEFQGGADGTGTGSPVAGIVNNLPPGNTLAKLRFDAAGNLYVLGGGDQSMTRFAPTADGFASPTAEILVTPPVPLGEFFFSGFSVH